MMLRLLRVLLLPLTRGPQLSNEIMIHPTAIISPDAELASDVRVGAFSMVHAGVTLAAGANVGAYCELGVPSSSASSSTLKIGRGALIRSHSIFYVGSSFGEDLVTGHHVTVRENTIAQRGLQIGTFGDIQGHCTIGEYVKTHSHVHIGQQSEIGNYVWMFPDVLLTNDPTPPSETLVGPKVSDFAILSSKVTLLPGVEIGKGAVVGAHSLVGIDVADGMLAVGNPAKVVGPASMLRMKDDPSKKVYPWRLRYTKGYPEEVIKEWGQSEA